MVSAIRDSSGACNTHILLGRASGQVCGLQQSAHPLWHVSLRDWQREAGLKAWVLIPWTLLPQGTSPEMIQLCSFQMRERREESKWAHSGMFSIDSGIPGSVSGVGLYTRLMHGVAPWMSSSRKCFVGFLDYKVDIWLPERSYMHRINHNVFHLLITKTILRAWDAVPLGW